MMLAIGATPGRLVRMVLTEAIVTGLIGVTIGTALGVGIVMIQAYTGVDIAALGGSDSGSELAMYGVSVTGELYPRLKAEDVAAGFVGVTVVSILAALWPALHTARLEPVEAMRS
jgi:ABC-type lipoprotein release transport system permease subunit